MFVDLEASIDRIEAAANVLTKFSAEDFGDHVFFYDFGEIIKKECADMRKNLSQQKVKAA
jgi:hypothetical protein